VAAQSRSYSLNAPVPGRVRRVADDLSHHLMGFDHRRRRHSVVCKRLGEGRRGPLAERARRALTGAPAVEARIDGLGVFEDPPTGSAPVVYLAVESPGLGRLHERLCDVFDPIPGLEGEDYVPHVTLARGGDRETARRLAERDVDAVSWTVSELQFWDARDDEAVRTFSLPG